MAPEDGPRDLGFEQFTRRAELELKFIEALSEARLRDAKSGSIEAHTLEQMLTNRCKADSIHEYELSLRAFHNSKVERGRKIEHLRSMSTYLQAIKLGHAANGLQRQNAWSAFKALLPSIPASVIQKWSETPAPAYGPKDWVGKTISGREQPPIYPTEVATVADLLIWQCDNHRVVVVRFGCPSHTTSLGALASIEADASERVGQLEVAIESIQKNTYSIWEPQKLITITDSPVN